MEVQLAILIICLMVVSAMEISTTLLTQYPMVMAHDAASGEIDEDRDHIVAKWTKTQSKGMVDQLKCGTRAFDYRPSLKDDNIYAHHGGITIHKPMKETVDELLSWVNSNPSDLVVLYISHFDGDGCEDAVEKLLANYSVSLIKDCSALESLTYGDAKQQAVQAGGSGRNGALLAVFDCTEENYDSKINCYNKDYTCYDSWPDNTSSVPMEKIATHLQGVTNVDPASAYKNQLWMAQAHWQSTAESITLGTLHGSSIVEDESRSKLNAWVESAVLQGQFAHVNFLELDEVCDNGVNVYKALQSYFKL